jgi:hypothetical protein
MEKEEMIKTDTALDDVESVTIDVNGQDNLIIDVHQSATPAINVNESDVPSINVKESDAFIIEVDEVPVLLDGDGQQFNHALLYNRELPEQHPIIAIEGLREELDKIESLQTFYSDKKQQADYYMWRQDTDHPLPSNPYGVFVSIYPNTDKIQICDGTSDVFGVTVADAAFVGNQEYAQAQGGSRTGRDGNYCLVVHSGLVSVRRMPSVVVGDYVAPNSRGEAEKSNGNYGYLVTAVSDDNGLYATISLGTPSTLAKDMADTVQNLDGRMFNAESKITSVGNVANSAYAMALDAKENAEVNSEYLTEKITEVLGKMDDIDGVIGSLNESVNNSCSDAASAKTIATNAVSAAQQMGDDAYASANEAIAAIKDIGAGSTSWAKRIDAYSVGEYSQAYGLTLEQAKSALPIGIVHIPAIIHTEVYMNALEQYEQEFMLGYYYTWSGEKWKPSLSTAVNFSSVHISGSEQAPYWVVTDADVEYNGVVYILGFLYRWNNGAWEYTGASVTENTLTRAVSAMHQTANELSMEVTNVRGDVASLSVRIDTNESSVQTLTRWTGSEEGKYNIATTKTSADDDGASIALVVVKDGVDEELGGARIVLNDNEKGSYIQMSADNIDFTADNYRINADKINFISQEFNIYPSDGNGNKTSTDPNFSVDAEGEVSIKGHVTAESGEIGGCEIKENKLVGGIIESNDYSKDAFGLQINLDNSTFNSPNFKINSDGTGKIGCWDIGATKLSISYKDVLSERYQNPRILFSGSTEMNVSGFKSTVQTEPHPDDIVVDDDATNYKFVYINGINTNPDNTYESLAKGSNFAPIAFYCGAQQLYDGSEMKFPFLVLADGSLYAEYASFGEDVKLGGQTIKSLLSNMQNLSDRMTAYEDGKVAGISIEECLLYTGDNYYACDILNHETGTISGTNAGGITITYPTMPFSVVCPYAVNVTYFRGTTVVYKGENITLYPYDVMSGDGSPDDMYYEIKFDVLNGSRPYIFYGEDENSINTITPGGWPKYPMYTLKCGRGAFDTTYGSQSITDDQWQIIVIDGDANNPSSAYKVLDYAPVITLTVPEN